MATRVSNKICLARYLLLLAALATPMGLIAVGISQSITNTVRLSQNSTGVGQNNGNGKPALSANGKVFAFSSTADNLISNDSNNRSDIFVGTIGSPGLRRISEGRFGIEANGGSFNPSVSPQAPNGFVVVAYASDADNIGRALVRLPDNNNLRDIYFSLPNRKNFTKRVSFGLNGEAANGVSRNPSVTITAEPNRMLVAYQSDASNLTSGDTNNGIDIFLTTIKGPEDDASDDMTSADPLAGYSTELVSRSNVSDTQSNGESTDPQISGNGRYVVFESTATNLVSGVTSPTKQIYLYDTRTKTTELISRSPDGEPGNNLSANGSVSFQGTFVAYGTLSSNILTDGIPVQTNAFQVVLYNRNTKKSTRVNLSNRGEAGNGQPINAFNAAISPNGRFVVFSDTATNLGSSVGSGLLDLFLRDIGTSSTTQIPQGFDGTASNGASGSVTLGLNSFTSLSGIASYLSTASNLVPGDTEGNEDVFATTFSLPLLPLQRSTTLEVPPDATPGPSTASITMEKFSTKRSRSLRKTTSRATKRILQYEITLYRELPDLKRADLRKKISTRNNLTFRNLAPGTYVSQYRTQIKVGSTIQNRSKMSPPSRFAVGTPTPTPAE